MIVFFINIFLVIMDRTSRFYDILNSTFFLGVK